MSNIKLREYCCGIIVHNVHAPTEDKSNHTKDGFYVELERVVDQFPKYHIKIQCKGRERRYFQINNREDSLHETSNTNGVVVVNFAT
jgi:hypothetical protein